MLKHSDELLWLDLFIYYIIRSFMLMIISVELEM